MSNFLCEPQMNKRGLYPTLSVKNKIKTTKNYMDFLQYADGKNDLNEISKILKMNKNNIFKIYVKLKKFKLVS